jgi:glutaminyl-peptide cyclotransferase
LTWKDNIVDVLDSSLATIETMQMFPGVREGWGITRNNDVLYVSNGSERIYKINAQTFESIGSFQVTMPNG